MCTAISIKSGGHYFGRTLDLEHSYNEAVTVTPRNFNFRFRTMGDMPRHYAIIGMAAEEEGYPLYYEAANERGLAAAGLNFPGSARYFPAAKGRDNIAPFELIPWLLARCENLDEARALLERMSICSIPFSEKLPLSPLHWLVADGSGALAVESVEGGLKIYDDPVAVLTNEPGFEYQMTHLCDYMSLGSGQPENRIGAPGLGHYSRGMGAIGLPGDYSSASRFVRAAFVKLNSHCGQGEAERVSQFFHVLSAVEQPRGSVRLSDGSLVISQYTSCISCQEGIYYYKTYENSRISAVRLRACELESARLQRFSLQREQSIDYQN